MNTKSSSCTDQRPAADFYDPRTYNPEESVGYMMRCVLAGYLQEIEVELEPTGLTHAQWLPLYKLSRSEVGTAAEMARLLGLDAGATTRMLDRLEAKGLIQRERSDADRRVVHLNLTREGKQVAKAVPEAMCRVHNHALADFTAEECASLKNMLRRMLANLSPTTSTTAGKQDSQ